jgi:hypothetical protein
MFIIFISIKVELSRYKRIRWVVEANKRSIIDVVEFIIIWWIYRENKYIDSIIDGFIECKKLC